MVDTWNVGQYEKFKAERSLPFFDLLALVEPRANMDAVDLGCGTGELTSLLHAKLRCSGTLGIDNSAAMLARSAAFATDSLRFAQLSITDFASKPGGDPYDLVFSNAALQWVENHVSLLQKLTARLTPEGQLAVQIPANHDHPAQTVAQDLARAEPYAAALHGFMRNSPVLLPEEYASLLDTLGFTRQHVRLQVYGHVLPDSAAVAEWSKGTVLTDYEKRMPPGLFEQFYAEYKLRLRDRLGDPKPCFFPFKRILMWASR